jgi:hypothetical protein
MRKRSRWDDDSSTSFKKRPRNGDLGVEVSNADVLSSSFMVKCLLNRNDLATMDSLDAFVDKLTTDEDASSMIACRSVEVSHYFIYMPQVTEIVLFVKYDEGEFQSGPERVGKLALDHFGARLDDLCETPVKVTAVPSFFCHVVQRRVDLVQAYLDRRIPDASTPIAVRIKKHRGATVPCRFMLDTPDLVDRRGEGTDTMFPFDIPMLDVVRSIQKTIGFVAAAANNSVGGDDYPPFVFRPPPHPPATTAVDRAKSNDDIVTAARSVIRTHPDADAEDKVQSMAREFQKSGSVKVRKWLEYVARLPLTRYAPPLCDEDFISGGGGRYALKRAQDALDGVIYGMQGAKNAIIETVAKLIVNPSAPSRALLLEGPPGCGKTTFATQAVGGALKRPVRVINVGGAKDSAVLSGHNYTYEGSRPGRILEEIAAAGVCDPVLVFDEVDKIGDHPLGHEIASILMSIVDPVQNKTFNDNYLSGISLDLSRVFVIFTCNHVDRVDRVLLDRVRVATVCPPTQEEKYVTTRDYIIPKVAKDMGLIPVREDVTILPSSDDEKMKIVRTIVRVACDDQQEKEKYTSREEGTGMRNVEKLVERVIMNGNIRRISDGKDGGEFDYIGRRSGSGYGELHQEEEQEQEERPWIVYGDVERTLSIIKDEREEIERAIRDAGGGVGRSYLQTMYT